MKCVGCETSGKLREKKEGKKYSSKAYDISCRNGLSMVEKAPGGIFKIHNSGNKDSQSTIEYTALWARDILEGNKEKYNYTIEEKPVTTQGGLRKTRGRLRMIRKVKKERKSRKRFFN